jgi:predicted RND superfamily exporter protein
LFTVANELDFVIVTGEDNSSGSCFIKEKDESDSPIYKQFIVPTVAATMPGASNEVKFPDVKYAKMYLELNLNPDSAGANKEPHYDKLEAFVNTANTNAPEGLKNLK